MIRKVFTDLHINVLKEDVLKRMGKKHKTKLSPRIEAKVNTIISLAQDLIKHQAVYEIRELSFEKSKTFKNVIISPGIIISSKSLFDLLKDCTIAAIIVSTIGHEITEKVNELMDTGNMSDAVIYDAYGSEAVEASIDYINRLIAHNYSLQGYSPTKRFSPGYGDLSLDEQPRIVEALNAYEIGIIVRETKILFPEKSVTAILGFQK